MMGVSEVGGIISDTMFMKKVRDIRMVIPRHDQSLQCFYMDLWQVWEKFPETSLVYSIVITFNWLESTL